MKGLVQNRPQTGWAVTGAILAGCLALIAILYRDTLHYLANIWNQWEIGEYGHGYLVLAISLYLIYRQRGKLSRLTPCASILAVPAIALCSLLWLVATVTDVQLVQTVALLLVIISVIWAILGTDITHYLILPLLFIGFALPIWSPVSPLLQGLTADAVDILARAMDLPVLRQEQLIVVPAGQLSIEEACSGLRYLLAALTLAVLYGYLNFSRMRSRILVVVIAAVAAILANIIRVFIVVYLAYATDMQHPLVDDHLSLGWYLFAAVFIMLVIIETLYSRYFNKPVDSPQPHASAPADGVCEQGTGHRIFVLFAIIIFAASGPAIARWATSQPLPALAAITPQLPAGMKGWVGPTENEDAWMPVYHGAAIQKGLYNKEMQELFVFVGYYSRQTQGAELINDLNHISNAAVWRPTYPQSQAIRTKDADVPAVLEQLIQSSTGQQRLVWYWYRVAGRQTINKYVAKGLQVVGLMTNTPQASVIAVAADIDDSRKKSRARLNDFVSVMAPALARMADGGHQ